MRISSMELLEKMIAATEKLATDEKLDTDDVEAIADAYDRVNAWLGSGAAFPRDIYAERMRIAEDYQMEDEMT